MTTKKHTHAPKPATRIDPVPKKTAATTATAPLHTTTDNLESSPDDLSQSPSRDQRSALDRERADMPEPAVDPIPPQSADVPVPDPSPSPEPHYPSGADEIMRRHRLIDPEVAKVKTEAEEDAS